LLLSPSAPENGRHCRRKQSEIYPDRPLPLPLFLDIYEREGYSLIGKYVHSYIDEDLSLVNLFNNGFLGIVREGEENFGFGKRRKT